MTISTLVSSLEDFEETEKSLHSETIPVIRRNIKGKNFDLAITNGRTRVWAERFAEIEPEFLDWANKLDHSDILWDIGASIGHFGIYTALNSNTRVYSFEPEPQNFSLCSLNLYLNKEQLNGLFTPLCFGIAMSTQLTDFYTTLFGAGEHTKTISSSPTAFRSKILLVAIDQLLTMEIEKPTAIKIDVDGSEDLILDALSDVIRNVDRVFMEINKDKLQETKDYFLDRGLCYDESYKVNRLSGGYYSEILNVTFSRN